MTEKRFVLDKLKKGNAILSVQITDSVSNDNYFIMTKEAYEDDIDEIVDLLNKFHQKNNEKGKKELQEKLSNAIDIARLNQNDVMKFLAENRKLKEENEQLRQTMQEVCELLEEEVDLFSDKATEHDVIAYREMQDFDNKDAYYICTATKKAIQMLKGRDSDE